MDPIDLSALTKFPQSSKVFISSPSFDDVRVALREVSLSNGEKILLYDTSGPLTQNTRPRDPFAGIRCIRSAWITERKNKIRKTQLAYAKEGIITKEMAYIATRENFANTVSSSNALKDHAQNQITPEFVIMPSFA